jgi:IS5 family transposase
VICAETGRRGLPAESVLRCALLKQQRQLSYEELAFHLEDSASFRAFARLPLVTSVKVVEKHVGEEVAKGQAAMGGIFAGSTSIIGSVTSAMPSTCM